MPIKISPHARAVGRGPYAYQFMPASVKQPEERIPMHRFNKEQMKTIRQMEEIRTNFLALPNLTEAEA